MPQINQIELTPCLGGSVTLNSSNPFDYPIIDFGFLSNPVDVAILREGIRSARSLYSAPAFKNSVFGTVVPTEDVQLDGDLDDFLHSVASPFLHGVGPASMSGRDAGWGVVNPDFRVKGTTGLRIVDASVLVSDSANRHFGF